VQHEPTSCDRRPCGTGCVLSRGMGGEVMDPKLKADLIEALEECAEYFANREDADHDGERYIPNKEMRLHQTILEIEARLDRA